MAKLIASGISTKEHLTLFDDLAATRLNALAVEAVLVYLIDTVDESALYSLAEQFDVLGYKGWILANTEPKRRELIKKAIELHRYKGTPWSIIEALRVLGYPNVDIQENLQGAKYNAQYSYNGTIDHNQPGWATFRVILDALTVGIITQAEVDVIKEIIYIYKNARSHLVDVSFGYKFQDNVATSHNLSLMVGAELSEDLSVLQYDNKIAYNGAHQHNGETDVLVISII